MKHAISISFKTMFTHRARKANKNQLITQPDGAYLKNFKQVNGKMLIQFRAKLTCKEISLC